jgi:hypothetical protein
MGWIVASLQVATERAHLRVPYRREGGTLWHFRTSAVLGYEAPDRRRNRRTAAHIKVAEPRSKSNDPQTMCCVVGPPFASVITVTPKSRKETPATINEGTIRRRNAGLD